MSTLDEVSLALSNAAVGREWDDMVGIAEHPRTAAELIIDEKVRATMLATWLRFDPR